jgi:hypothetical protein
MAGAGNPSMAQNPVGQNVYQTSSNLFNQAAQGPNIGQFMNPFTQAVTQRTLGDIGGAQQQAMNQLGAQATQAGAFGGSRHGVAEALTNQGFIKQAADTAANLNMQGFNTALGAAQNQQGIQSGLAGQGFGFGQQLGQQQMQQGAMAQALNQALIDAAKGQYAGFTGAPMQALTMPLAAVGGANMGQQSQTTTSKPGLFDFLTAGATILGGLCWVAREVYGPDDHRWIQFRQWLTTDAPPWLLKLYARHGERFAGVVRRVPLLKRLLRPLMDRARRAAGYEN